jgi:hypothetical protein
MKKIMLLLVLMVSIALVGCNKEEATAPEGQENQEEPKETKKEDMISFEVDGKKVELETMTKELPEVAGAKSVVVPEYVIGKEANDGYIFEGQDDLTGVNIIVYGKEREEKWVELDIRNNVSMLAASKGGKTTDMNLNDFPELKDKFKTYHVIEDNDIVKHFLHAYTNGKLIKVTGYLKKDSSKENYGELGVMLQVH